VADSRKLTESLKRLIDLGAQAFGDIGAVFAYVEKNFAELEFASGVSKNRSFTYD